MRDVLTTFNNKKSIILIISTIILILFVIALKVTYGNINNSFQFSIECRNADDSEENIYANNDIICDVYGNVKANKVSGIDTSIVVDNNLSLNSDSISVNDELSENEDFLYYIDKNDNSVIILEANDFANVTEERVKLITFKVNAVNDENTTGTIKLTNSTIVSDNSDYSIDDYSKEISISKLPEAAYLTSLTIDGVDIFNFKSNKFIYETKTINKDKVSIIATTDDGATIKEDIGTMDLNYGKNDFTITVISSTNIETVYKFSIYRPYASTLLEDYNVVVNNKSIELDKSLETQNITVNSGSIEIIATGSEKATVNGAGIKSLNIGNNVFEILVASEDQSNTKKYILNVYRQNNDTSIKELYVNETKAESGENNIYNANINASNISINVILNDTNATYKLYKVTNNYKEELTTNNLEITDGSNNIIEIVVLAEDGESSKTYTLKVHELSSDTYLESLTINGLNFVFNKNTFEYNLNTELAKINIEATTSNAKSSITGVGAKSLALGNNTFKIIVTAEDSSTRTYTLNITRTEKLDDSITFNDLTVNEGKKYIYKIEPGTSLNTIISNIKTKGKITISKNNVNVAATGQKLKIEFDDHSVEYTIIVTGDVNGDGKVTLSDITTSLKGYKNKITLTDYMITAVDFNADGKLKLSDIVSHLKYYKSKK